jgi:hypothetical protein
VYSKSHQRTRSIAPPEPLIDGSYVEQLESRLLLAGSVKLAVSSSGNVTLKGDGNDNYVEVSTVGNQVTVEGLASPDGSATTIKVGKETFTSHTFTLDATSGKLQLKMGGGDDFVRLTDVEWDGDINFSPGGGGDSLYVSDSVLHGTFSLKTGGGNDAMFINDTDLNGDLIAKTGNGADWIALIDVTANGAKIDYNTGGGADLVSFESSLITSDVAIKTGGFPDEIYLASGTTFDGAFEANLGSFADALKVENGVTFNDLANASIDASKRGPNFENAFFREQGVNLNSLPNLDSFLLQFTAATGTTVNDEFEARLANPAEGEGLTIAYLDSLRTGLFRRGFAFSEMALETTTLSEPYMQSLEATILVGMDSNNSLESRLYSSLFGDDYS